jgi:hypothetical protein
MYYVVVYNSCPFVGVVDAVTVTDTTFRTWNSADLYCI